MIELETPLALGVLLLKQKGQSIQKDPNCVPQTWDTVSEYHVLLLGQSGVRRITGIACKSSNVEAITENGEETWNYSQAG